MRKTEPVRDVFENVIPNYRIHEGSKACDNCEHHKKYGGRTSGGDGYMTVFACEKYQVITSYMHLCDDWRHW